VTQAPDRLHGAHVSLGAETGLEGPLADVKGGGHIGDADRPVAMAQDPVLRIAAVLFSSRETVARPGCDPIPCLQLLDQAVAETRLERLSALHRLDQLPGKPQQGDHRTGAMARERIEQHRAGLRIHPVPLRLVQRQQWGGHHDRDATAETVDAPHQGGVRPDPQSHAGVGFQAAAVHLLAHHPQARQPEHGPVRGLDALQCE